MIKHILTSFTHWEPRIEILDLELATLSVYGYRKEGDSRS